MIWRVRVSVARADHDLGPVPHVDRQRGFLDHPSDWILSGRREGLIGQDRRTVEQPNPDRRREPTDDAAARLEVDRAGPLAHPEAHPRNPEGEVIGHTLTETVRRWGADRRGGLWRSRGGRCRLLGWPRCRMARPVIDHRRSPPRRSERDDHDGGDHAAGAPAPACERPPSAHISSLTGQGRNGRAPARHASASARHVVARTADDRLPPLEPPRYRRDGEGEGGGYQADAEPPTQDRRGD